MTLKRIITLTGMAAALLMPMHAASAAAAPPTKPATQTSGASILSWRYYGTYDNLITCQAAGIVAVYWDHYADYHCDGDGDGSYELWVR
jgi:hypothetical protein